MNLIFPDVKKIEQKLIQQLEQEKKSLYKYKNQNHINKKLL